MKISISGQSNQHCKYYGPEDIHHGCIYTQSRSAVKNIHLWLVQVHDYLTMNLGTASTQWRLHYRRTSCMLLNLHAYALAYSPILVINVFKTTACQQLTASVSALITLLHKQRKYITSTASLLGLLFRTLYRIGCSPLAFQLENN